jgi:hypothetical protein
MNSDEILFVLEYINYSLIVGHANPCFESHVKLLETTANAWGGTYPPHASWYRPNGIS